MVVDHITKVIQDNLLNLEAAACIKNQKEDLLLQCKYKKSSSMWLAECRSIYH